MSTDPSPPWTAALTSPSAFADEQRRLGGVWNLLGLTTDVSHDGDWIRATLGGRSVFVQRFGDELRAYENVCAHRFYPLRTEDKGNGAIQCGFHHWQYNKDGVATGIPKCKEMFGKSPREMDVRLREVEVATCGVLIFGRFADERLGRQSLEEELGDVFPIVQTLCNPKRRPREIRGEIAANWRLLYHISLDDYHIVAVHPESFGKRGYLPADAPRYYRFGRHSAYRFGGTEDSLKLAAAASRRGEYRSESYQIVQLFPNVFVVDSSAGRLRYVLVHQFQPLACDKTLARSWYFPTPVARKGRRWWQVLADTVAAPIVALLFPFYTRKIYREDNVVCEGIQSVAGQIDSAPILARHEERIGWFEESYAEVMAAARPAAEGAVQPPQPLRPLVDRVADGVLDGEL